MVNVSIVYDTKCSTGELIDMSQVQRGNRGLSKQRGTFFGLNTSLSPLDMNDKV
jgi:hypothetical protein